MAAMISAIVPTYQRSHYLAETLDALISQTRPLHQIIIWDDGSTDSTNGVARAAIQAAPSVVSYHHDVNGGKSRALNKAMAHATGDYIWICDDDDLSLPDAAERLGGVLDTTAVDLSGAPHLRFSTPQDGGDRVVVDAGYWPDLKQGSVLRHTLEDMFFFQNGSLVRRAAFDRVGPFREDLARSIDLDMTVRLLARGPAHILDDPVFLQRKHDGARGPAAARHAAARSEEVWRDADRGIFQALRDVLPLSLYGAMFAGDDPKLVHRAALIQRATVYARRCDWTAALTDFAAAADHCPNEPLTRLEWDIAIRAMAGKHGAADAFTPPTRAGLREIARKGPAAQAITRGLARGARWRLRAALQDRETASAAKIAGFIAAFGIRTQSAPVADSRLRERTILPPQAYAW
jgi:glycosyltransferase involved in cell wall biosynthesis